MWGGCGLMDGWREGKGAWDSVTAPDGDEDLDEKEEEH